MHGAKGWSNGRMASSPNNFSQLFREAEALQKRLPKADKKKKMNIISHEHVSEGNLNYAIKLLSNNTEGGVMPLNHETKALLKVLNIPKQEKRMKTSNCNTNGWKRDFWRMCCFISSIAERCGRSSGSEEAIHTMRRMYILKGKHWRCYSCRCC